MKSRAIICWAPPAAAADPKSSCKALSFDHVTTLSAGAETDLSTRHGSRTLILVLSLILTTTRSATTHMAVSTTSAQGANVCYTAVTKLHCSIFTLTGSTLTVKVPPVP